MKYILKVILIEILIKEFAYGYIDFCFGLKPITIAYLKENYGDIIMFVSFMMNSIIL